MDIFRKFFGSREIPDRTPMEVPLRFRRPLTLQEEIKRYVREEASQAAERAGLESWEESQDFEVDEDEPLTPHEMLDMQEEELYDVHRSVVAADRDAALLQKVRGEQNGSRRGGQKDRRDPVGEVVDAEGRRSGSSGVGSGGVGGADEESNRKGKGA